MSRLGGLCMSGVMSVSLAGCMLLSELGVYEETHQSRTGEAQEFRVLVVTSNLAHDRITGDAFAMVKVESALARYWLHGDEQHLHLYVQIEDDDVQAEVKAGEMGQVWRDDAIELFIDPTRDEGESLQDQDLQLIVNANGATFLSRPVEVESSARRTEVGWEAELTLPWTQLGILPEQGLPLGVNLALDDLDHEDDRDVRDQIDLSGSAVNFTVPSRWQGVEIRRE